MSDTLLTHARNAFNHREWAALIQDIREFLAQHRENHLAINAQTNGGNSLHSSASESSAREAFLQLAIQALLLVDFQTRWELVSLIAKFGPTAIAPLMALMDQFQLEETAPLPSDHGVSPSPTLAPSEEEAEDWDLLWFIARILGNIQHPDAITALIQILQTSPSEDVVTAAVMALAQQGIAAIAPLNQLINHDATKLVATQALAQIFAKDPNVELRDTLITITQDPEPSVREVVIEALSHSHQTPVTDILITASNDFAASVRRAAIIGLGMRAKVCEASILPTILSALEPRLWDLDTEVRRQTAIALGRVQTLDSAQRLFTALIAEDFPAMLKPDVVRALIWTNTAAGLDRLNQYLCHHHPKAPIYQEIAIMLGRVESTQLYAQATHILLNLLANHGITQQSVIIKQSIAMSLGQLKQVEAEPALIQLSQDEDERVKLHAIAALKTLKGEWTERSSYPASPE